MPKNYFFDMYGTLYQFDSINFDGSSLQRAIKSNIISLLESLGEKDSTKKYIQIEQNYGEDFSLAFEYIYGILKEEYFSYVWNLYPQDHICCSENIISIFKSIGDAGSKIYIYYLMLQLYGLIEGFYFSEFIHILRKYILVNEMNENRTEHFTKKFKRKYKEKKLG